MTGPDVRKPRQEEKEATNKHFSSETFYQTVDEQEISYILSNSSLINKKLDDPAATR